MVEVGLGGEGPGKRVRTAEVKGPWWVEETLG